MKPILFFLLCIASALHCEERELNPYGSVFYSVRAEDTYVENVGAVTTYQFIARKFFPNTSYILATRTLNGEITPVMRLEVDDEGQLGRQIDAGTLMLDNERILMFDFCKGEPIEYWITSLDGKVKMCTSFVPYPITTQARDGASVSIRRLTPDARLVLVEGYDFDPDEKVYVSTQSSGSETKNVPFVCTNGKLSMIIEPAGEGKSGGTAYLSISRMKERLVLEFDWGCEATNPKKRMANTQRIKQDALLNLPTELR